jgi:hypothetical protein
MIHIQILRINHQWQYNGQITMNSIAADKMKNIDMLLSIVIRMSSEELTTLCEEYKIADVLKGSQSESDDYVFSDIVTTVQRISYENYVLEARINSLEKRLVELVTFIKNNHIGYNQELQDICNDLGIYS